MQSSTENYYHKEKARDWLSRRIAEPISSAPGPTRADPEFGTNRMAASNVNAAAAERSQPCGAPGRGVEHEHSESAGGDHSEHGEGHEHHEHSHTKAGHSHNTYGNELFFVLGTKAIPYVTPSMLFVSDLNNSPGSYLEIRLDGAIPIYREILKLQPYALLRLNLGYNTNAYYGSNNFQFGLEAIWRINRAISIFGGINYSVAMTALRDIDQGNEV